MSKHFGSHPDEGTCGICGNALGAGELLKRRRSWVHKLCWLREKGE